MLTIRLSRTGKRHQPQYRIVVQQKTQDPWAPAIDIVGTYNPHTTPSTIELKEDRIKDWLSKGAQPSESVHNMFVNAGILKGDKAKAVKITKKRAAKLAEKKAEEEEAKRAAEEAAKAAAAEAEAAPASGSEDSEPDPAQSTAAVETSAE